MLVGNTKPTKIENDKSKGLFSTRDIIIPVRPNTIKCVLGKAISTKINALK